MKPFCVLQVDVQIQKTSLKNNNTGIWLTSSPGNLPPNIFNYKFIQMSVTFVRTASSYIFFCLDWSWKFSLKLISSVFFMMTSVQVILNTRHNNAIAHIRWIIPWQNYGFQPISNYHKQPREVFCKKVAVKNIPNFTRKHRCFFNKVAFYWKEAPTQVIFWKICEIFKNTYFEERMRTTASELLILGTLYLTEIIFV